MRTGTLLKRERAKLDRIAADLQARGFRMVTEEFGPPATGKTLRARQLEKELATQGKEVRVVDGLFDPAGGGSGVQVWAKG